MTPSSASTVSGVVCEALRLGEPFPASSELARGWPPTPTPAIGRSLKASSVTETSRERPLVTSFADRPPTACGGHGSGSKRGDQRARRASTIRDAPVGSDERDAERHDEERDEARLRVRVEEAPEQERDEHRRDDPVERSASPDEDGDEQDGDRNDEVPAVQARVLEERGDAEERRVRIRDLDVSSEEQRPCLRLPDPDRGEERAERDERDAEARAEATPRRARAPTVANPATNGKTKNASAIPPARSSQVQRNEVAEKRDERGERQREQERWRRRVARRERSGSASASTAAATTRYSGSRRNASSSPNRTGIRNGATARSTTGTTAG